MQNVFLVEDSPLVRERLEQMLGAVPGTRVVGHASSAEEAVRDILAARPDVVLLDLKLAQGSGFQVLSAVHRAEPGIDIYMLSNFASEPYRQHARRLGALGFFDKSTDFERLRDVIAQRASTISN